MDEALREHFFGFGLQALHRGGRALIYGGELTAQIIRRLALRIPGGVGGHTGAGWMFR